MFGEFRTEVAIVRPEDGSGHEALKHEDCEAVRVGINDLALGDGVEGLTGVNRPSAVLDNRSIRKLFQSKTASECRKALVSLNLTGEFNFSLAR